MSKPVVIKIAKTGQRIIAKSYGNGFVDAFGNFWHKSKVKLIEVL